MRVVNVVPRTPEWHAWRNQGVTATDACVLMGSTPDTTLWRLWAEKVGLVQPPDLSRNPLVRRGIEKEPVARKLYEQQHGTLLLPVCGESDEHPVIRASFDGLDDEGATVEIKCPSESVYKEAREKREASEVCARYYPQVQQQIYIAGASRGYLVLYGEDELLVLAMPRNDAFLAALIPKAIAFWEAIEKRIEPAKDPARDVFVPVGAALEGWTQAAETYRELEAGRSVHEDALTQIAERQKALQDQLLALMGNFAHGAATGIRVTRYLQRGSVDYGKLLKEQAPEIGPDLMERYRRSASQRVRVDLSGKPDKVEADRKDIGNAFTEDADPERRSLYF